MKPKIGITPQYDHYTGNTKISPFYAKAVENAGGIPLILPYVRNVGDIEEMTEFLDGIIFSGGTNIDPRKYGENVSEKCGKIEFERDVFELDLCRAAIKLDKPTLGICRGCQLLNVCAGGTLYQHVDSHDQSSDKHIASHTVKILKDTPLYDILKADEIDVNSFHHQIVKDTASLKCAATSNDGQVEAVFMPGKKFHIGIQWHPERMYDTNLHAKMLFDAFISACS